MRLRAAWPLSSMTNDVYRDALSSAILDCLFDRRFLHSATTMGNQNIKRSTGNFMLLNPGIRPICPNEVDDLIDLSSQFVVERLYRFVGGSIEVDTLGTRCDSVDKFVDDWIGKW
jgi:hypothetical protein